MASPVPAVLELQKVTRRQVKLYDERKRPPFMHVREEGGSCFGILFCEKSFDFNCYTSLLPTRRVEFATFY
jgi:hypothetical protein